MVLARDVFERWGVDLENLDAHRTAGFESALGELIGIAHDHLENALRYTLMIPAHEKRIRRFCLWALGMAVLTLRKINSHRDFTESRQVKIKRRSVRATVLVSNLSVTSDWTLRTLFALSSIGLPSGPPASAAG